MRLEAMNEMNETFNERYNDIKPLRTTTNHDIKPPRTTTNHHEP